MVIEMARSISRLMAARNQIHAIVGDQDTAEQVISELRRRSPHGVSFEMQLEAAIEFLKCGLPPDEVAGLAVDTFGEWAMSDGHDWGAVLRDSMHRAAGSMYGARR